MKKYLFLITLLGVFSFSQTQAGWLIAPSGKLTTEDKIQLEKLQKYQEPLNKKKSSVVPKTTPSTPTTTDTQVLAKQLDTIFANLKQKIATRSITSQNTIYTNLISRIKNIQAKSTNLSEKNTFILNYLLKKAEGAIQVVKNTSGTGTTSTTATGGLATQKTIGNLTLLPSTFLSQTGSTLTLGKFSVSGEITLNDLYITIVSDEAIKVVTDVDLLKIRNGNGQVIGNADSYEFVGNNTLKVYFDAAYFLRAGDYSLVTEFEDRGNTYFKTYIDYLGTSRGNLTYSSKQYLLGDTAIKK